MAPIAKTYDAILSNYASLFYNPSKKFITAADELNMMNMAITLFAKDIGGIRMVDTSNTSVKDQRDYVISKAHKRLVRAQYIRDPGLSTEVITPLDIIDERNADFIRRISLPESPDSNSSLALPDNKSVDKPKYAQLIQELFTLRLYGTPNTTGDTIKLWTLSIPSVMSSGVEYDGEEYEVPAIAFKMASLAHRKMKDTGYAQDMDTEYLKELQGIRSMKFKERRPRQLGDGRFEFTRLRSVDGSH